MFQEAIPMLRFKAPLAASSFCTARAKLDECIFKEINSSIIALYEEQAGPEILWDGHRIYSVDGTKINLPRELTKTGFKTPNKKTHYPQGLLSTLYNIKTQMPLDFSLSNNMSERNCVEAHLETLGSNDVVVYDRGYFSYEMLKLHLDRRVGCVFRLKSKMNLKPIQNFIDKNRRLEAIVEIKPENRYGRRVRNRLNVDELEPFKLRIVKYKVKNQTYYLATTLLDSSRYTIQKLSDLYHSKWGIEEFYKIIKRTTVIEEFHGKSPRKFLQEIYAHMLIVTISRIFTNAREQQIPITEKKLYKKRYVKKTNERPSHLSLTLNTALQV